MEQKKQLQDKAVLSVHDLQKMGFCRTMAYRLLNRSDMPVIIIGGRKFMHRELFEKWLAEQTIKGA